MNVQALIPKGSTGKQARSGGVCVVCGLDGWKPSEMVVRSLYWDWDSERYVGHKVCKFCSPTSSDQVIERLLVPMERWSYRWNQHLDDDVYTVDGQVVREL